MTKQEAAVLVGKSIKTIERWEREGVRIYDETILLEHSAAQDARSRGKTRNRIAERIDAGVYAKLDQRGSVDLASYFPTDLDDNAFVDLPAPFDQSDAAAAADSLSAIKSAFERRLADLQTFGHQSSIDLAAEEVARVNAIIDLLSALVCGYEEPGAAI
jgi:hypothetical protein